MHEQIPWCKLQEKLMPGIVQSLPVPSCMLCFPFIHQHCADVCFLNAGLQAEPTALVLYIYTALQFRTES